MAGSSADRPREGADRPPSALRASLPLLLVLGLLAGFVYPTGITGFAHLVTPGTASGSLLKDPNGTPYGLAGLGENITNPAMFWLRPSLIDDQAFESNGTGAGDEVPPGPTDPALVNETDAALASYCNETVGAISIDCFANLSVPIDLLTPSASGLDPDLTPAAALVQIPRVAFYSGLSEEFLRDLVNERTVTPALGLFGPAYVNIVELDVALLPYLPAGTGYG